MLWPKPEVRLVRESIGQFAFREEVWSNFEVLLQLVLCILLWLAISRSGWEYMAKARCDNGRLTVDNGSDRWHIRRLWCNNVHCGRKEGATTFLST
ncbi:hypothetical protein TNCT_423701 [Trichonephila clavata]|uniref:Uncharacterized protein n=1 Tax=Trichonephila clavata TaxID=2740835 RepID=A0A8X6HW46_TRICU|nr:hypothetical protein TNCT_423701 [Trichonephila clavata]